MRISQIKKNESIETHISMTKSLTKYGIHKNAQFLELKGIACLKLNRSYSDTSKR